MVSVYRVIFDIAKYQYVVPDDVALLGFQFDGDPIGEIWKTPSTGIANPLKSRGDFLRFGDFSAFVITPDVSASYTNPSDEIAPLNPAVTPDVSMMLTMRFVHSGEILPVNVDGVLMHVVNITYVFNCLDKKRSRFNGGSIEKYEFHRNRLGESLFKIPETRTTEILTVEGIGGPEDQFKSIVEDHGLKGISFEKIWSE